MAGLLAYGGYVPRLRLQRAAIATSNAWFNGALHGLGKGERAIAGWDEDAVTIAVEAARDCLHGQDRTKIGAVYLSSTALPFADRQNAGLVKEALNLSDATATLDIGGSQRAGTSALIQALAAADGTAPILVAAAEKRLARPASEAEMHNGDGAAALLVGDGPTIADVVATHSHTVDFVDHYRAAGEAFDYGWETRWVRDEGYMKIVPEAMRAALDKAGLDGAAIDHFILPCPYNGIREAVARQIGISPHAIRDTMMASMGEAGSAHPLVMLAQLLDHAQPGQLIAVAGFGQGCDVLLLRTTDRLASVRPRLGIDGWLARGVAESNYTKFLFWNGLLDLEKGIRAEQDKQTALTVLYRNRKALLGLVAARNLRTGSVQYPPSPHSVHPGDQADDDYADYPLADVPARILTHTSDRLTYTPDPPACYGIVEFEGGGRMIADFVDVDPAAMAIGMPMRMVFRVKLVDPARGFKKYFWKAAPAIDAAANGDEGHA